MHCLLAIILPPVAVFLSGMSNQAILNIFMAQAFRVPGTGTRPP